MRVVLKDLSRKIVDHHVSFLEGAGQLAVFYSERECFLFPADAVVENVAAARALADPRGDHLWAWLMVDGPRQRAEAVRHGASFGVDRSTVRRLLRLLLEARLVVEEVGEDGVVRLAARYCRLQPPPTRSEASLRGFEAPDVSAGCEHSPADAVAPPGAPAAHGVA